MRWLHGITDVMDMNLIKLRAFSVGKALVLCMSGGSAAKHGVCGVAPPWWAYNGILPSHNKE